MKKIIMMLCLMLSLATVFAVAEETGESPVEQTKALMASGDAEGAVAVLEEAAATGDAALQNALGYCYAFGMGVEQDWQKAVEYYTLSAEQGYAPAQSILGYEYLFAALPLRRGAEKGRVVERN